MYVICMCVYVMWMYYLYVYVYMYICIDVCILAQLCVCIHVYCMMFTCVVFLLLLHLYIYALLCCVLCVGSSFACRTESHRPPKGHPKRGIRPEQEDPPFSGSPSNRSKSTLSNITTGAGVQLHGPYPAFPFQQQLRILANNKTSGRNIHMSKT